MDSEARRDAVGSIEDAIGRFIRSVRTSLAESAHTFAPDLQPSAYAIMGVVYAKAPVAPATIIASTGMDKSSVSRQLRALKDAGHVTAQPDPDDRRADLYSPTPEAARFGATFDEWEEQEVVTFAALLEKFTDGVRVR